LPEREADSLMALFSLAFVGGFDLASEWMGWENVFHCENNPFCQRVLKYYWPNSIAYDDIKKTDFRSHRGAIDIVSGGFP
jgi:DNA (cytosine-5)-methyltransferase 1